MSYDRFWSKVDKTDTCWLWNATRDPGGYGVFNDVTGRKVGAHRWAWIEANGPVPDGLELDHLCRVRECVNPAHLEPVTRRENVLRGVGIPAVNARKTHCAKGHPLIPDNLYNRRGRRECKTCSLARARALTLTRRVARNAI